MMFEQTSEFIHKVILLLDEYKSLYQGQAPYTFNEKLSISEVLPSPINRPIVICSLLEKDRSIS